MGDLQGMQQHAPNFNPAVEDSGPWAISASKNLLSTVVGFSVYGCRVWGVPILQKKGLLLSISMNYLGVSCRRATVDREILVVA